MKIKKITFVIVLSCLFMSCRTVYDPSMLHVKNAPNSVLIKTLEISRPAQQVNNTKTISVSAPVYTLFERNLETNWMENNPEKIYGKIELIEISNNSKMPLFFPILSGATLGVLNLLGMPTSKETFTVEYDIIISDLSGRKIQKYNYTGKSKTTHGWYYGKDGMTLIVTAIKDVMAQFDSDLKRDAKMINDKLDKGKK